MESHSESSSVAPSSDSATENYDIEIHSESEEESENLPAQQIHPYMFELKYEEGEMAMVDGAVGVAGGGGNPERENIEEANLLDAANW